LRSLRRGEQLFRPSDERAYVYSIDVGAVKTYRSLYDCSERICRFHLPGELLGVDALFGHPLRRGAVALTASTVFMIPVGTLLEQMARCESTLSELLARFYDEVVAAEERLSPEKFSAEVRLATFILRLMDQLVPAGAAPTFRLPMSKKDIGNHLGLVPQTISRVLARFEERQLLSMQRGALTVHDSAQLRAVAGGAISSEVMALQRRCA
jgi:CRP/FNR family transcriptional regulator